MHFSLSLDLVSWRANLWMEDQRSPHEKPAHDDASFTLRKPPGEAPSDHESDDARAEQARFVRQPVRVVFSPRRPPHR